MSVAIPPPGATVRIKRNDCNVPIGSEGIVAYIHSESRLPVVLTGNGRPVALLPDQLEVLSMPAMNPVRDETVLRLHDEAKARLNGDAKPQEAFSWTLFDPRPATVTLTPSTIRLSVGVAAMLSSAERVQVLFDQRRGAIALQPAKGNDASFKLSTSSSGATVSAREFLKLVDFSGVRQGKPMRLEATRDDATGRVIVTGVPFLQGAA